MTQRTLVILNPNAGNGRTGRIWPVAEPLLKDMIGPLEVAITNSQEDVRQTIEAAYQAGIRRLIGVGGDGTNYVVVNALALMMEADNSLEPMIYGTLPAGTGRDWARSRGVPLDAKRAVEWLANATPQAVDIGHLHVEGSKSADFYFLNIASAGLGGEVDRRVNRFARKYPWTFLQATVETILFYKAQPKRVLLDGEPWLDQRLLLAVVANGTTFGHGMRVAPDAQVNDGLFDVIVLESMSRFRLLRKLWHVYNATHLKERGVLFRRAKTIEIISPDVELAVDMDGEPTSGTRLRFEIRPRMLQMLL